MTIDLLPRVKNGETKKYMPHVKGKVGSTRLTKNYKRKRLAQPSTFSKFRTIERGGKKIVIGKSKKTGKWKAQAVLTKRKK